MLARTFGCARVVFNDSLRTREDAHEAGQKVSDTEVQRRVVTLAKTIPGREWLGKVRTHGGRPGTGSIPCPVSVRAARLGIPDVPWSPVL